MLGGGGVMRPYELALSHQALLHNDARLMDRHAIGQWRRGRDLADATLATVRS